VRTVVLRVVALALLLLLAVVSAIVVRTLARLPDTVVYMVRDEGATFTLESVLRRTRSGARDVEASARRSLAALSEGPTADEASRGLASEVPEGLVVHAVRLQERRLEVDLGAGFAAGGGTASMLGRLHQVHFTLSQPQDVDEVALYLDGRPLTVLGGEGVMVDHPWSRPPDGLPRW
jgi:spore germination protein GerM